MLRRNKLLVVFSIFLAVILILPPLQSTNGHSSALISEVELNPPGNDNSNDVIEQIELYNPNSEPRDVSGWTLSSIAGEPVVITLEAGSIISAKGVLVIGQGSQWLDNEDEVIELMNADGVVMDRAGPFWDKDDDGMTWQRVMDGLPNWEFKPGTLGSPNSPSETQDQNDDVSFVYGNNSNSAFGQISGKYTDPSLGLEIELPQGWSGIGFPGNAIITPGGMLAPSTNDTTTMLITTINVTEIAQARPVIPMESQRLTDPQPQNNTITCTDKLTYEQLNDMVVMHSFSECSDPNDPTSYTVSNIYNAAKQGQIIGVGLSSNSPESYKTHIDGFEKSIKTLKVSEAIDHRTVWFEPLGVKSEIHSFEAKGAKVDIQFQTNSEISNLVFNEEQKRLSFRVEGEDGAFGLTVIPISRLLEGPYTVMVDGEVDTNLRVFDDQASGETRLEITYEHSAHDISISGTNVVPEFPFQIIGVAAAMIAIVTVIGRLKHQAG